MSWQEQAESMAKVWGETQKKMWDSWLESLQSAPTAQSFQPENLVSQWQKMATQGFETWLVEADPTAKEVAHRLFSSQKAMLQFFEFAFEAWKKILPQVEAGQDWQTVLANYSGQLQQQLTQSAETMLKMGQDSQAMWQLYQQQSQKFLQPWLQALQQPGDFFSQNGQGNSQAFFNLSNLYWDSYEQSLGGFLDSPTLGYTREFETMLRQGFKAWQNYRRADFEYQLVVINAWVKTFEKLQQELVGLSQKGETITSLEQFATVWTTLAEDAFSDVFRSEKYIRAQGKLLKATMNFRIQQRQMVEWICKIADIPTRSEVDEIHRTNYELRKEVKALKKNLATTAQAGASVTTLQTEIEALKATVATLTAKPKRSSRAKTTKKSAPDGEQEGA